MKLDMLGITETKKKKNGMTRLSEGYWLYWSGVEDNERAAAGIGIIVNKDLMVRM